MGQDATGETEPLLPAVLISDDFHNRFRPLSLVTPRCLLPLANIPLIEYTLEFLAVNGVHDVYVFCASHVAQVREYIRTSRWTRPWSTLNVQVVVSSSAISVGDVLREVDAKQLITGDFLLVTGDLVSTIDLKTALKEHRTRRETVKNKDAIMTMVLREGSPGYHMRYKNPRTFFAYDASSMECLACQSLPVKKFPRRMKISADKLLIGPVSGQTVRPEIRVRSDFIDCQIDICSVDVPPLFTENFDYQEIRKDFVRGILTSDLLGKQIYISIASKGYAARMESLQAYEYITSNVLERWTYPMTLDSNMLPQHNYSYFRHYHYKEDVTYGNNCQILSHVAIGEGTRVDDHCLVENSIIGRNCRVGATSQLCGAYLFNNVSVGERCFVGRAILADDVVLGANVRVENGAIISYRCFVPSDTVVSGCQKLYSPHKIPIHPDSTPNLLDYVDSDIEEQDEDEDSDTLPRIISALGLEAPQDDDSGMCDSSSDELESVPKDDDSVVSNESDKFEEFLKEAEMSLARAYMEEHPVEVASLELNTLKMAANVDSHDLRFAVTNSIYNQVVHLYLKNPTNPKSSLPIIQTFLTKWLDLYTRVNHSIEDRRDTCIAMHEFFGEKLAEKRLTNVFLFGICLRMLYQQDIVDEDNLSEWLDTDVDDTPEMLKLLKVGQSFLQQLQEVSSEEES